MMEATNIPIEKDMIKVMANVIPTAVGVSMEAIFEPEIMMSAHVLCTYIYGSATHSHVIVGLGTPGGNVSSMLYLPCQCINFVRQKKTFV